MILTLTIQYYHKFKYKILFYLLLAFQASVMEEIVIIKKELVIISADKMDFQQEAFESLVKTEKATSIMNVELAKSIAISAELNNIIVRIEGTVASEKVMVAETNSRVKNIQKNLSKVVDKGPVMINI